VAHYKGFACDSCNDVLDQDQINKRIVRFVGPDVENGQYTQELCGNCITVPEGVTLKATPGRKVGSKNKKSAVSAASSQPLVQTAQAQPQTAGVS
jgi:hypothetical protein